MQWNHLENFTNYVSTPGHSDSIVLECNLGIESPGGSDIWPELRTPGLCLASGQSFSVCGSWAHGSNITWKLLEMQILKPSPGLWESETLRVESRNLVLMSSSGDSDAGKTRFF